MVEMVVGLATCGISAGASAVYDKLSELIGEGGSSVELGRTGCIGMCFLEPIVEVRRNGSRLVYGQVDEKFAEELYRRSAIEGEEVEDHLLLKLEGDEVVKEGDHASYYVGQTRLALANCGLIDPESIDDYIARGGYEALKNVLSGSTPDEIVEQIKASGLRGRGGGGFPTGLKWSLTAKEQSKKKYVICNADEGDPGAFMDRSLLEGDPHAVLEGMIICGYAIGADFGYIYCRAEYPLAVKRLRIAIEQARERGFIGKGILDTNFRFDLKVKEGAGAFVCGEETALIASIEGRRGMPRVRPPYPAAKGLWQKPTNNNNVETYANVPWIIRNGGDAYAGYGTEKSRGTKVFALAGRVQNGGLAEVPMGMSIRDLVMGIGGGIKEGGKFKGVQMGGPSGGCIPEHLADTPVDFENIPKTGAIMGSGGMVVMDDKTCMVDVARFFLDFTQKESCGKCTFCRVGTLRMLEILERICEGKGEIEDIERLKTLADQIKNTTLCGLGNTAPNPVLTTLKYFEDEYLAHIQDKKCPAKVCSLLVDYVVKPEDCIGCGACIKVCPNEAITGEKKKAHVIDAEKCVHCGMCVGACPTDAIMKV